MMTFGVSKMGMFSFRGENKSPIGIGREVNLHCVQEQRNEAVAEWEQRPQENFAF